MDKCKLMIPLFCGNLFNREGRKMRAVFEREISNGAERYRIWRRAGKATAEYPRAENDKYILYVELNGYLVSLRMTDYDLISSCGYPAAVEKLYGDAHNRAQHINTVQESGGHEAVLAALSEEREEIVRCGSDSSRQTEYIQKILAEHSKNYLEAKEDGGASFPDFIGALLADDLARCVELSAVFQEKCRQKKEERAAIAAEEDRIYCEERNREAQQVISKALQVILNGGELKNEKVTLYQSRYQYNIYSIFIYLMRMYQINVPLRTQGWINERLTSATIKEGRCTTQRFLRSKKGQGSQKFFNCMDELIRAVVALEKKDAANCA